jgi:MSHA biogenesis protein MshP
MRARATIIRQRGSALFAALFLLIVVGALGAYAVQLGVNQDHATSLQLLQVRAESAAMSGLEFGSYRARVGNNCPTGVTPVSLAAAPEFSGFGVGVSCTSIVSGTENVYILSAAAVTGVYGSPDFVQRTLVRRVTNIGPGTW